MEYNIVTVIDIGTTKIATIVAQYSKSGSIEILGHSVVPCKGLSKGNVVDVAKTFTLGDIKQINKLETIQSN